MYKLPILRILQPILLLLAVACKKNDTGTIPPPPVYSDILVRMYELDTTKTAPNDTITRRYFQYDNNNRLIVDSTIEILANNGSQYSSVRYIYYNGNDSMASKVITKNADTTWHVFSEGKYVSDSTSYFPISDIGNATSITRFTYQPGVIIRYFQNWIPQWSYSAVEQDTIYQTIENGNIVYQIDTLNTYTNGQFSGSQIFESRVFFISNPNPFFKLLKSFARPYFYSVGIGNRFQPTNNVFAPRSLISSQTSSFGNIEYKYMFREDGYPLSAIMKFDGGDLKRTTKLIFHYK